MEESFVRNVGECEYVSRIRYLEKELCTRNTSQIRVFQGKRESYGVNRVFTGKPVVSGSRGNAVEEGLDGLHRVKSVCTSDDIGIASKRLSLLYIAAEKKRKNKKRACKNKRGGRGRNETTEKKRRSFLFFFFLHVKLPIIVAALMWQLFNEIPQDHKHVHASSRLSE